MARQHLQGLAVDTLEELEDYYRHASEHGTTREIRRTAYIELLHIVDVLEEEYAGYWRTIADPVTVARNLEHARNPDHYRAEELEEPHAVASRRQQQLDDSAYASNAG